MLRQAFGEDSMSRPNSPRPVTSKVKSMLIIFFDIKEIVHKEFILADQTVDFAHYYDVLW
jgi:hypothetical protein